MHSMKNSMLETWSEQETCTSKQPFVNFQALCLNLCFVGFVVLSVHAFPVLLSIFFTGVSFLEILLV